MAPRCSSAARRHKRTKPHPDLVCDLDSAGNYRTVEGTKLLKRGRVYEIQVTWFEATGGHRCTLEWKRPQEDRV
eukprot:7054961-Prymnesium_polylepis.1